MKQFFESFPTEIEEAARVDGANRFRIFAQIVVPNAIPAISALTIFTFQGSWNAFLEPLIFISGSVSPSRANRLMSSRSLKAFCRSVPVSAR